MSTTHTEDSRKPLADRLVHEAMTIVRELGGPDSVSLREVQRRAGVSPAAAYRHFRDREALLLEVAQESAGLLADELAAAVDAAPVAVDEATARARILAVCEGYVAFAVRNPGLYRAIYFSGEQVEDLLAPSERARGSAGEGGYNMLIATLRDLAAIDGVPADPWDTLVVWSCIHGLAVLRLDSALRSLSDEVFSQARDRVLQTISRAAPLETLTHAPATKPVKR